jgi:competence protein ComK
LITGEYDQFGKHCTRVMAGKSSFLVDSTPLQLLDETLTYIGFDLRGAITGAKTILGKRAKCPIILNPYQGICLFPSKSPNKIDCIWFNPDHIVKTKARGNTTEVFLSNGYSIIVDCKRTNFNNKIEAAHQLKRLSEERGHHQGQIQFYLEPSKKHQLSKMKSGKYNFDVLIEDEK